MARNLVKAGHSLSVFDLSAEAMDAVVGGKVLRNRHFVLLCAA